MAPVQTAAAMIPGAQAATVLGRYRDHLSGFDEMMGADGIVKAHWQPVIAGLEAGGRNSASMLYERIQRRIVENGLRLDSFSDPNNAEQPWQLDLVPLVFDEAEWGFIERAMIQRARLAESLLGDLYGAQKMMTEGLLPASLIFNDPTFLRPLHGADAGTRRLMFMAVDLARDHAGNWRILDTHAETMAGQGYAIANRVVLADAVAQQFRDCNARRITQFFQTIAAELIELSGSDEPTLAILGPDPDDDTYLGHAYLARYLGVQLLQGTDLRVVGGKVYQKTLAGLQPIELLLRAVEAARADPLELDPHGFDGAPGLVQAVRENPALITNALGTAIVENRGLAPYMAGLCQRLLGEAPLLPDAERLWLGDRTIAKEILANPGDFLLRPAFEGTARPGHAKLGQQLSAMTPDARDELIRAVEFNGAQFVAERPPQFATAPSWTGDGLKPRPYALRVFISATADGYQVMPGGIALTIDSGAAVAMSSRGAHSRDVWVATREPQGPHYSRWLLPEEDSQIQRMGTRLPSRVADNMFWLGRYVDRADWTLRVMRNALRRGEEDLRPVRRTDAAESALEVLAKKGRPASDRAAAVANGLAVEDRVRELFDSAGRPYGVRATFQHIRALSRQARDRLSSDAWGVLSGLTNPADDVAGAETIDELIERIDQRILDLAAFNGLVHENMTRNYGWRFLDIGRRIERALQMSELLRTLLSAGMNPADETERLAFLLETTDSFMTYRGRYRFAPTFPLVLDLLLVDETNPRGLAFQLVEIEKHIAELPKASVDAVRTPEQRLALDVLSQVRLADLEALRTTNEAGERVKLAALLDRLMRRLPALSDVLSRRYFSLTEEQPHRVHTRLSH